MACSMRARHEFGMDHIGNRDNLVEWPIRIDLWKGFAGAERSLSDFRVAWATQIC